MLRRAEGEKKKSTGSPVINSFAVIKTPESLKGVSLLMSCDIFEARRTLNGSGTVCRERRRSGPGREEKKKRGGERGRWDAFFARDGEREADIIKYQGFVRNGKIKMGGEGSGAAGGWGGNCV